MSDEMFSKHFRAFTLRLVGMSYAFRVCASSGSGVCLVDSGNEIPPESICISYDLYIAPLLAQDATRIPEHVCIRMQLAFR